MASAGTAQVRGLAPVTLAQAVVPGQVFVVLYSTRVVLLLLLSPVKGALTVIWAQELAVALAVPTLVQLALTVRLLTVWTLVPPTPNGAA